LFILAAKHGYTLPAAPKPRYQMPPDSRSCPFSGERDPTFMPRDGEATAWATVLTAYRPADDAGLLPFVNVSEAIRDLPPIMASPDGLSSLTTAGNTRSSGCAGGGDGSSSASAEDDSGSGAAVPHAHTASNHPQPAGHGGSSSRPAPPPPSQLSSREQVPAARSLVQYLQAARASGMQLLQAVSARKGASPGNGYGTDIAPYAPHTGLLLTQLPDDAGLEGGRPVSAFAEWCRAAHWPGQVLSGPFHPDLLASHRVSRGEVPSKLRDGTAPDDTYAVGGRHCMQPDGLVATVTGTASKANKGRFLHFAEPRCASLLERVRLRVLCICVMAEGKSTASSMVRFGHSFDSRVRWVQQLTPNLCCCCSTAPAECLQRRLQSVPDFFVYFGQRQQQHQQIGNAVPYLLAAEVAASVWEAATGQPGRRPPDLAGPSPSGIGLVPDQVPAYRAWVGGFGSHRELVVCTRAALAAALIPEEPVQPVSSESDMVVAAATEDGEWADPVAWCVSPGTNLGHHSPCLSLVPAQIFSLPLPVLRPRPR
jgi:hypothetical protein